MTPYPAAGLTKVIEAFEVNDVEEATSTITYIGQQSVDGQWFIQKIDESTGITLQHATKKNNSAVSSYSDAWTNRASLSYGDVIEAF